jgi:formylglycine-generating enzyme
MDHGAIVGRMRRRAAAPAAIALMMGTCLVACQLIAGIDELTVAPNEPALPDASVGDTRTDVPDGATGESACGAEGKKECVTASTRRVCTRGRWQVSECGGVTPGCNEFGDCVSSCTGLAKQCGVDGKTSCCAAFPVTKAAFYRSYDGVYLTDAGFPAETLDYKLDAFEVTVGRFRKFLNAYPGSLPSAGAGKRDANDPGWDPAWNAAFLPSKDEAGGQPPPNQKDLTTKIQCNATYQTWTGSTEHDNKPMNCITWYEANAFCIWDGGRLPTEAEWNAAASALAEQRVYPWSDPPANQGIDATRARYGCDAVSCPDMPTAILDVGSLPLGAGKFGQLDLAGNLREWVRDFYVDPYPMPCSNCAQYVAGANGSTNRVLRGGDYGSFAAIPPTPQRALASVLAGYRIDDDPIHRSSRIGVRCARPLN